jgi:O-antigen ligase
VRHADGAVSLLASSGLAVVGMYALCALSDNVFYRAMPHSLYFFLVLGFSVSIGRLAPPQEGAQHG